MGNEIACKRVIGNALDRDRPLTRMHPSTRVNSMLEKGLSWLENFRRTKVFDLLAALPLILWYLLGLRKQMPLTLMRLRELINGSIDLLDFLQLVALVGSFALIFVMVYLLLTRSTPELKSYGVMPRMVAVCGTFLGNGFLYLGAVELSLPTQALADILIIAGTIGSLVAVSRLGGSFSLMPEARKLVTKGPYAVIRHPLYLAEMIGVLGLVLQFQQPWALFLGATVFGLQYWRTVFEERVLMQAYPDYINYRTRTWRFLPYVF
jgi:protein-S-isoprenylcysteine O-methyltransferase Ste14